MHIIKLIAAVVFDFGMLINAVLFVPQAVRVFRRHSAIGLSLITYVGYNVIQILMIAHAIFHHDIAMAVGMSLALITCGAVTVGILCFRPEGNKYGRCYYQCN